MSIEIERKFLVRDNCYKEMAYHSDRIAQGYICRQGGNSTRVRVRGNKGYLTIKGPSIDGGLSRYEWEKEITESEAWELMKLCPTPVIDKTRYLVEFGGHTFEVDEFYGENEGLVVAEIELTSLDEEFSRPPFLGDEVTGDSKYYNSSLSRFPYKCWK